jgi:hypothetical protein
MKHLKGLERKRPWPNLMYYRGILLERLGKNTKALSQDWHSPGRDLNQWPPEYEAGVLITRSRHLVSSIQEIFLILWKTKFYYPEPSE